MSNYEKWMLRLRQMFPGKTDDDLTAMIESGKVRLVDDGWPAFADFEQPKTLSALIGLRQPESLSIKLLTDPVPEDPEEWKKYAREREEWKELAKEAKQERFDKAMTRKHLRDIGAEGGKKSRRRHPARDLFDTFIGESPNRKNSSRAKRHAEFAVYFEAAVERGDADGDWNIPGPSTLDLPPLTGPF